MVLETFFHSIVQIVSMLINGYIWIIILQSLIALFQPSLNHPIVLLLNRLTSPIYQKIRRIIPAVYNNIDFSPLILIIFLKFIDLFLIKLLLQVI